MNGGLKWKLIAGFVLVFVAGIAAGIFFSASFAHTALFGPGRAHIRDRMRNRLRSELRLSDEQVAKISPVIDKAADQIDSIRTDTARHVRETFAEAHREIAADLTPEQRQKLQEIEERHRRQFHHLRGSRAEPTPEQSPAAQ
jgi:Spy/CpxP family protein refolding chaperone